MKSLELFDLESIDDIVSPDLFECITFQSPAYSIFTDFKKTKPLIIEGDTIAEEALTLMQKAHVKIKVVVSESNHFIGIITTKELSERHIVAEVAKGNSRREVRVDDLMIPRDQLHAFDYDELITAKVIDVISDLNKHKLKYCMVLDKKHHHIRGIISLSDINDKLNCSKLLTQ